VGVKLQDLAALPPKEKRYPLYRRIGVPMCTRVRKISLRTVQPLASLYNICVIPAHDALFFKYHYLAGYCHGDRDVISAVFTNFISFIDMSYELRTYNVPSHKKLIAVAQF
jgi:hypothetical protein